MFSTVLEHSGVVSSTLKNVRALDCVSCSKVFLRAGNNPAVLKNSTEHAETLFIALISICPILSERPQKHNAITTNVKNL